MLLIPVCFPPLTEVASCWRLVLLLATAVAGKRTSRQQDAMVEPAAAGSTSRQQPRSRTGLSPVAAFLPIQPRCRS